MMQEAESLSLVGFIVTISVTILAMETRACIVALKKHVFPRFCKDLGKVVFPLLNCSVGPACLASASV
jgi:hypothetical protein